MVVKLKSGMSLEIENLIVKFLTKEANLDELQQLELWINDPKNEVLFLEYIKTNAFTNIATSMYDKESAKENITRRIKQEKRIFLNRNKVSSIIRYAAAAIVIGVLTTAYIFKDRLMHVSIEETAPKMVSPNVIMPGTDKATLTLGDGSVVVLNKENTFQTQNVNSNGEQIVYKKKKENKKKNTTAVVYNFLTIPRGGQFFIKLSDGTQVWLNSESQLKYPVNFIDGETRQVELVYGEAYFNVSPSTEHKGAKFKVLNQSQEIEVLGTEFNIKAYKDETNIYTTLVEGKVAVGNGVSKLNLVPNEQSNLDTQKNNIVVTEVDVSSEISWKNGIFSFKGKPLKNIMKVISRWYDVDVIFENKALETLKFKGSLDKNQSIEEILSIMKSNTINNYEIKDKTIILK